MIRLAKKIMSRTILNLSSNSISFSSRLMNLINSLCTLVYNWIWSILSPPVSSCWNNSISPIKRQLKVENIKKGKGSKLSTAPCKHVTCKEKLTLNAMHRNYQQMISIVPCDPCQNQQLQPVQRPCPALSAIQFSGSQVLSRVEPCEEIIINRKINYINNYSFIAILKIMAAWYKWMYHSKQCT